MDSKNILIIVEGARTDTRLMIKMMENYGLDNYNIVSYNTNIYVLYKQLFVDGSSYGVDLLQTLIEHEKNENIKEKLKLNYTHIILCFDLDPHDSQYSNKKIIELSQFFNESTENGKLYLNYPMIESYSHRNGVDDLKYKKREVTCDCLLKYKQIVNKFTPDPNKIYDSKNMSKVIYQNLEKANYIIGDDEKTLYPDLIKVLEAQIEKILKEKSMFVLCTCIFFIVDYNKNLLQL